MTISLKTSLPRQRHLRLLLVAAGLVAMVRPAVTQDTPPASAAPGAQDLPATATTPATEAHPAFEVASVKKSGPMPAGAFRFGMQPGGRFAVSQMPLTSLITMAYGIQRFQLVGGPGWINSDRFDINAKAPDDTPVTPTPPGTPNRMQLMLRSMLEERFALEVHNETREMPVGYLVMAREDRKLGERLRPSTVDCVALMKERAAGGAARIEMPKPGETPQCGMMGGFGRIAAGGTPLSALVSMLAIQLNRPIYDRTNLTGSFDFLLEYTPDQMPQIPAGATLPPGVTLPSPDGPSLLTALQEQLGLKLEYTRGRVEVLVIDSVSQPTPD